MNEGENKFPDPAAPISLEQVEGLDVAEGLERCVDDRELYQSVLIEFRDRYENMTARLETLLTAGQWGEAERLTHAAAGTAGMLSANDLHDATATLNATLKSACASGVPPSRLPSDLERFSRELARVMGGISRLSKA